MDAGYSKSTTIIVSIVCGLIMMTLMAILFHYMKKLNDSGTLKMENALNSIGEVYLTVGASRSSIGKVQIKNQLKIKIYGLN